MEMNTASQQLEHQRLLLRDQQSENAILRGMLLAHGIPFEHELEGRKMNMSIPIKRDPSSVSPAHIPTHPSTNTGPASAAGFSPLPESVYPNGTPMSMAGHSPSTTFQGHSPAGPEIQEFAIKQERDGTPDMPGIFEREPQLGIDFILQCVYPLLLQDQTNSLQIGAYLSRSRRISCPSLREFGRHRRGRQDLWPCSHGKLPSNKPCQECAGTARRAHPDL